VVGLADEVLFDDQCTTDRLILFEKIDQNYLHQVKMVELQGMKIWLMQEQEKQISISVFEM
jgi:hypothetical protein